LYIFIIVNVFQIVSGFACLGYGGLPIFCHFHTLGFQQNNLQPTTSSAPRYCVTICAHVEGGNCWVINIKDDRK